jgi:hypothetical protein
MSNLNLKYYIIIMTFWGKPKKIDIIKTYQIPAGYLIPESILEEDEYMIFHTKKTYGIGYRRGQVYWILLSSKGRLFSCEYKSKNFEVLDHIIYNMPKTGKPLYHDIEQAFICNGWLLILENLDYSGCLVINRSWQDGGSFFDPLITLLKTYTQLFPETIINIDNKDQDKFFRIKSGEEEVREEYYHRQMLMQKRMKLIKGENLGGSASRLTTRKNNKKNSRKRKIKKKR